MSITTLSGGELSAFRSLRSIDQEILASKARLASGVRLAAPSENPAVWRISAQLTSRAAALAVLRGDLDRGHAVTAMSVAALARTKTSLSAIRSLLTAAKAGGADLAAIQRQLATSLTDLRTAARSAAFAGVNLLMGAPDRLSFAASRAFATALYGIEFDKSQTLLFGDGSATGILDRPLDLSALSTVTSDATATGGLSGAAIATPGVDAVALATGGLAGAGTNVAVGVGARDATGAFLRLGLINPDSFGSGDRLRLQMTVGGVSKTVTLPLPSAADQNALPASLQAAIDAQFGANTVVVSAAFDGAITLETVAVGSSASLSVGSIAFLDGNGTATSTLGLTAQSAYSTTQANIGGQLRTFDALGNFSSVGFDRTDRLRLQIDALVGGQSGTGTIEVALATVTDSASLAAAINETIAADPFYGAYAGAAIVNGEVVVHLKMAGSIRVSAISGLDGDATVLADTALQSGTASGMAAVIASPAAVTTGSDFTGPVTLADGMSLQFDLVRNGNATAVEITKADVESALALDAGYVPSSGTIADVGAFARVVAEALSRAGISDVAVAAVGQRLRLTGTGIPATGDLIALSNVGSTGSPARAATLVTSFAAPLVLDGTQSLTFDLSVDGGAATSVTIDSAMIDSVLGGDSGHVPGSINTASDFARVLQRALADAGVSGVDVGALSGELQFSQQTPGAGSLLISGAALHTGTALPSDTTLLSLDVTSPAFSALDRSRFLGQLDVIIANVDTIIGSVSSAQAYADFVGTQLDIQTTFNTDIESVYREVYGDLMDTDMTDEQAHLTALEAQRALLSQSISIMNQSHKNILILFKGMTSQTVNST